MSAVVSGSRFYPLYGNRWTEQRFFPSDFWVKVLVMNVLEKPLKKSSKILNVHQQIILCILECHLSALQIPCILMWDIFFFSAITVLFDFLCNILHFLLFVKI